MLQVPSECWYPHSIMRNDDMLGGCRSVIVWYEATDPMYCISVKSVFCL
jgi:hypothetical protein